MHSFCSDLIFVVCFISLGILLMYDYLFLNPVELLLYSPDRPIVDYSVSFLWLMAVGTIICAALWKKFTQSKESDYYELPQEPPSPQIKKGIRKLPDMLSNLTCSLYSFKFS